MTRFKCLILFVLLTTSGYLYAQSNPNIANGRYGIGGVYLGQSPMEIMSVLHPGQSIGVQSLLNDWCKEVGNSRLFNCDITSIGTNLWIDYERPSRANYFIYNGRLVLAKYEFKRRIESMYNFSPFNEWIDEVITLLNKGYGANPLVKSELVKRPGENIDEEYLEAINKCAIQNLRNISHTNVIDLKSVTRQITQYEERQINYPNGIQFLNEYEQSRTQCIDYMKITSADNAKRAPAYLYSIWTDLNQLKSKIRNSKKCLTCEVEVLTYKWSDGTGANVAELVFVKNNYTGQKSNGILSIMDENVLNALSAKERQQKNTDVRIVK